MNEHRWRFKVGSKLFDDFRATDETASPSVQVLEEWGWKHWAGAPVAEEILRLAGELARVERDSLLKEQELLALADSLEEGQQTRPLSRAEIAERIRDILRLPE